MDKSAKNGPGKIETLMETSLNTASDFTEFLEDMRIEFFEELWSLLEYEKTQDRQ